MGGPRAGVSALLQLRSFSWDSDRAAAGGAATARSPAARQPLEER